MALPISIIIPAYNAAATIGKTIESLLCQTFGEWEAIVINDGSTDGTTDIVREYAEKDKRISLVNQANQGVSAARNRGIAFATYNWLLFMDADDWIADNHLEKLTTVLEDDTSVDLVHSGWCRITPEGIPLQEEYGTDLNDPFTVLADYCPFVIHACIVRKSIVKEVGEFDTALQTCEDWDLWQRIARVGATFRAVREVSAFYRMQFHSLSRDAFQFCKDALRVLSQACDPDPRLQHLQRSQAVRSKEGLVNRKYHVCSWAAGLLLGNGEEARRLLDLNLDHQALGLEPYSIAENIFKSTVISQAQPVSIWPKLWPSVEQNINDFLIALETQSGAAYIAQRTKLILERKILQQACFGEPVTIGATYGIGLDITQPIETIYPPLKGVERLLVIVKMEGEEIGRIELPVFNGFVAGWVIKDAIAAKLSWQLLSRYFEHTVYKAAGINSTDLENIHNEKGWGLFLQELWDRPNQQENDFYDSNFPEDEIKAPVLEAIDFAVVEVSDELPQIKTTANELNVLFTVGGVAVGVVSVPAANNCITPQALIAAITTASGFELCRICVREALLGHPIHSAGSLRQRLRQAAGERNTIWLLSGSYCLPDLQEYYIPSGSAVLGSRNGRMGTSISRYAILPAAAERVLAMAKAAGEPVLLPAASGEVKDSIFYIPSFIKISPFHSGTTQVLSQKEEKQIVYGRQHFETIFSRNPDPWKYTAPYEQIKYEQTLSLIPQEPIKNALELACAEGHFTTQLAPLVQNLIAADISRIALERAEGRCQDFKNITFRHLDLMKDPLPQNLDLIVCSEVLYYIENKEELTDIAQKFTNALRPGGYLVMAHAHLIVDEPDKPGFDWGLLFGAKGISDAFSGIPDLRLLKEIWTPLYRIQLFQKHPATFLSRLRSPRPEIIRLEQPAPVPEEVVHTVRWSGGKPYEEVQKATFTNRLPILMYHRVAPSGLEQMRRFRLTPEAFEEQLQYLRDTNYYSVSLENWLTAMMTHKPLPGKAIAFTFDDGYTDFYEYAWPLLKKYGFNATVFLVSDHVGQFNAWDKAYGEEVPLMDWDKILQLQKEGVVFGAHSATHPPLTALTPTAIVEQVVQSRKAIQQKLESPVTAFAYPYGDTDAVVAHLTGACGFTIGVSCQTGLSTFSDSPLSLPRIEVKGTEGLDHFIKNLSI